MIRLMSAPLNPYVAGNPVGDSPAFVGRNDVLREVLRVLRRPKDNALVLYGQRRIGKTSILEHLATWLPREGPYKPVYFDLQDKAGWTLDRVLESLAANIAGSLGQEFPDLGSEPSVAFRGSWLPELLASLSDDSCLVLLFDEFDVLADSKSELAGEAFFPYLRHLLTIEPTRLQFVFVMGRNVDDLNHITLSFFKGTDARRISPLSFTDTLLLVRLSEIDDTLHWKEDAMARVWELTHGNPYLTQQLCSHVWERAHADKSERIPTAKAAAVEAVIDEVLDASQNSLEWVWNGIPPAERVVTSALAGAGSAAIDASELEKLLNESGVRVVIRDLQSAPRQLQDRDILKPEADDLRFRVELFRRWVVTYKPLHRVQQELDYIEPVAQNLYQAGRGLYQSQKLQDAIAPLRQALGLNPNHLGANQLLAEILLSQGRLEDARQLLDKLYLYQPAAARPRLVQVLMSQAQSTAKEEQELTLYGRILEIDPSHSGALSGKAAIWSHRGERARKAGQLEQALEAFETAGSVNKASVIRAEIDRVRLETGLEAIKDAESQSKYKEALELCGQLAKQFPKDKHLRSLMSKLRKRTQLAGWYREALGAMKDGDSVAAQGLLARIVAMEPDFGEARRYLYQALTDGDPRAIESELSKANFDVFLSHNSKSKPTVRKLADALVSRGLRVWFDERELVPGRPWQDALEEIIKTVRTAAVLVGKDGLGPWEEAEMRGCLSEFVDRKAPVIPVLLPGSSNPPDLPLFLRQMTWVDLRGGLSEEGLDRLEWGITGSKPTPSR